MKTVLRNRTTLTGHRCTGVQLSIPALLRCTQNIIWICWRSLQCLLNTAVHRTVTVTADSNYKHQIPFPFEQRSVLFSSAISTVWIALWKPLWNKTVLPYWSKFNCHHTAFSFLYRQRYFAVQCVCSEHKTTKVIICSYW